MPLPSSFESELFFLMNQWKRQAASDYESISVSLLLPKQVDNVFFSNVRELLKILPVLPKGEHGGGWGRFLLFGGSIRILGFAIQWPPNDQSDLAVIAMHANTVSDTNDRRLVWEKLWRYVHPRQMTVHSLLADWLTVSSLLYFCVKAGLYGMICRPDSIRTIRTRIVVVRVFWHPILRPDSVASPQKSVKSLACDTTKNTSVLILQYAYSFWLTDDCFYLVLPSYQEVHSMN